MRRARSRFLTRSLEKLAVVQVLEDAFQPFLVDPPGRIGKRVAEGLHDLAKPKWVAQQPPKRRAGGVEVMDTAIARVDQENFVSLIAGPGGQRKAASGAECIPPKAARTGSLQWLPPFQGGRWLLASSKSRNEPLSLYVKIRSNSWSFQSLRADISLIDGCNGSFRRCPLRQYV